MRQQPACGPHGKGCCSHLAVTRLCVLALGATGPGVAAAGMQSYLEPCSPAGPS
jgi:hypothetical protein